MDLSSLKRLRLYCEVQDLPANNRKLLQFLPAVSTAIEEHLRRAVQLTTRTEDLDTEDGKLAYLLSAFPILSIANVWTSTQGHFDGEELLESVSNYHISAGARSLVMRRNLGQYLRGIRVEYLGGLAADAVESTYTLTGPGAAAFEAGQFVKGSRTGAVAEVVSNTVATTLVLENLYGAFKVGDVLKAYADPDCAGSPVTGTGGTVSAIAAASLAQAHPAIVSACELEVDYLYKNSKNSQLWTDSTSKEGTQKRGYQFGFGPTQYSLQPEVRLLLKDYVREVL